MHRRISCSASFGADSTLSGIEMSRKNNTFYCGTVTPQVSDLNLRILDYAEYNFCLWFYTVMGFDDLSERGFLLLL